ncbi:MULTISPECIES: DEAD/DEAH box helicase [Oscillospiraceae]|uniref:SNF2-related protein n=1 Tax=Pseudobacteroides cellulosolvens ATCC 35603 = DSM 2933 TaxID=398512 RepID=A0A0L6JTP5_9FIRM|nr:MULTISPECIES: DEAD/DEAH box helicase [Oscillospiraceae]KNY29060.1 SNF2-related protein [Pseudobacteroides cellulosolvens ATCC 35603 = DSM 2933]
MIYEPHDYQKYAHDFIIDKPASALLLDLGLGKTVITLTAINELLYDSFEVKRVLVIAPLRVAQDTWGRECQKWDHLKQLRISKILGNEEKRIKAVNTKADIYIINRENVEWLVDLYKGSWPYDMVVVDELSSFKSATAKRFRALRKVRPYIKRIVGLTGTPAPNGLIDLWSQVYLLDRGERLEKTLGGYREKYFLPDKRSQNVIFSYKPKDGAEREIYRKISDICISMKACDHLKMPERIDNFVPVHMSEKEEELYRKLEREALLPFVDGDVDAVNAAVLAGKLLQMSNGAVYDENGGVRSIHRRKLEMLEDLIESANGKPVLVYYAYKHDRERILKAFKARDIDTPKDISDWNDGRIGIAIAHPASAGHGLNLQAGGSTIIWFGLTWSLELYQQANGRIHRQGQTETVIVNHIITAGTMDEQVMAALNRKETGQTALINAVRARMKGGVAV